MEVNDLFGLPAHPLVVHAAVVLLPLAAIGTVVCAALPQTRRHYAPVVLGFAVAAALAVGLAQGSGEELEERVDETRLVEEHAEKGESVLPWALAVVVLSGAVTAVPVLARRRPNLAGKTATAVVIVASLVVSVGATWTIIDVGHSGAKATWNEVDKGEGG